MGAPKTMMSPPPGERLKLRSDGTMRPLVNPRLCLGAEGGVLAEGKRLLFWECGDPPHRHERFSVVATSAANGRSLSWLRSDTDPAYCAAADSSNGDQSQSGLR